MPNASVDETWALDSLGNWVSDTINGTETVDGDNRLTGLRFIRPNKQHDLRSRATSVMAAGPVYQSEVKRVASW